MPTAAGTNRQLVTSDALDVHSLGVVDYPSLLALQEHLIYEISGRSDRHGVLLLCEHPPVVTVGREGGHAQFAVEQSEFAAQLMDVHWVARGAGNLVHIPGQLAAYLIAPLQRLGLGLSDYTSCLEQSLLATCAEFDVTCHSRSQQPGAWARTGQVGYVAGAVKYWTTHFGLYLNVSPKLYVIRQCDPSGRGERQSSLTAERLKHTPMNAVRESLARNIAAQFGYEQRHWFTGHPSLVRTKKIVHVHA